MKKSTALFFLGSIVLSNATLFKHNIVRASSFLQTDKMEPLPAMNNIFNEANDPTILLPPEEVAIMPVVMPTPIQMPINTSSIISQTPVPKPIYDPNIKCVTGKCSPQYNTNIPVPQPIPSPSNRLCQYAKCDPAWK